HPLTRALRPDKLCLTGLQETLLHYLREEAIEKVPVWRMIAMPLHTIADRAAMWRQALSQSGVAAEVVAGRSTIGGGSLPGETLPTSLLSLPAEHPDQLARLLRDADPPVIGRIEDDRLVLDPRTVLPEDEQTLLENVVTAVQRSPL
ncbi:MAG: aminotransferase class V-fold PLP-dependent enzyme, partial [Chloroflexota bacterium]